MLNSSASCSLLSVDALLFHTYWFSVNLVHTYTGWDGNSLLLLGSTIWLLGILCLGSVGFFQLVWHSSSYFGRSYLQLRLKFLMKSKAPKVKEFKTNMHFPTSFSSSTGSPEVYSFTHAFAAGPSAHRPSDSDMAIFNVDSAAGMHITNNVKELVDIQPCQFRILGLGGYTYAYHKGTFKGKGMRPDGLWGDIILNDVLFAKESPCKLFSWRAAKRRNAWIDLNGSPDRLALQHQDHSSAIAIFDDTEGYPVLKLVSHRVYVRNSSKYPCAPAISSQNSSSTTAAAVRKKNNHYAVQSGNTVATPAATSNTSANPTVIDINSFHNLHGHPSLSLLRKIATCSGITLAGTLSPCEVCALSNFRNKKIAKTTQTRSNKFLGRIFVDLTGPMMPAFESGVRYFMVIVDDMTRYKWVYGLKDKSAFYTAKALSHFFSRYKGVECVRLDNGTEWKNELVTNLFIQHSIVPEFIPPYNPQFNGVAESAIAHLRTVALSLLNQGQCDGKLRGLWFEAVKHAARLMNNWPCVSNPHKQSPNQYRNITDLRPLFLFGSKAYVGNRNRSKAIWENETYLGIYVGAASDSSDDTLRVFNPGTNRFVQGRSVETFNGQFLCNPMITGTVIGDTAAKAKDWLNWFPVPSKSVNGGNVDLQTGLPHVFDYNLGELASDMDLDSYFDGASLTSVLNIDDNDNTVNQYIHDGVDLPVMTPAGASRKLFLGSEVASSTVTSINRDTSLDTEFGSTVISTKDTSLDTDSGSPDAIDGSTSGLDSSPNAGVPLQPQILFRNHLDADDEMLIPGSVQVRVHPLSDSDDECFTYSDFSSDDAEFSKVSCAEELPNNLCYDDLLNANREPDDVVAMNALLVDMIEEVTTTIGSDSHLLTTNDPDVIICAMNALSHEADILPSISTCPKTFKEAKMSAECSQWEAGMKSEYNSLVENNTWSLVDKPLGANVVGCRWVYQKKLGPNNEVIRYKCRLVAQGFRQREHVDYDTTYSPVVGLTTIRTLLAQAAACNWPVYQMDVVTAFLQAPVDCDIFMEQAPGFAKKGDLNKVYKLNKAIYGLKQSPFLWNCAIHQWLVEYGFTANAVDRCLYVKTCPNSGKKIILTIYVDDLLITGEDTVGINKFRLDIQKRFKMTDLGEIHHCLGFQVTRDSQFLHLRQTSYIDRVLERFAGFGFHGSESKVYKTKDSPAESGDMLKRFRESKSHSMVYPYRELIGSLKYLTTVSRPDIANVVRLLSKFTNEYQSIHVKAAQRVLRYLAGTKDLGLKYNINSGDMKLRGYSDSSYADNVENARSTTGFALVLNGSAVVWKSRCQQTVARSTCEAEYMSMSDAVNEIQYVRQLLVDMSPQCGPTELYCDNDSAIKISQGVHQTKFTRHINVRYHNVKEHVANNVVVTHHVRSELQAADMLTKNCSKEQRAMGIKLLMGG